MHVHVKGKSKTLWWLDARVAIVHTVREKQITTDLSALAVKLLSFPPET